MGEALVRHAEAALARRGCLKVNLQVVGSNADIVPFYTAMGYEIEPHISLGKKLYQRLD
jgi:ribosomal protein S18 acetylase RimI-like enzyme